ncbi:MAG: T9SS type A sorting domain-containing protein [Saprospiraceae bacterium]|nr:T9SS type A sorting domain-containing protein [Saprospiraceae bacterium]
MFDQFGNYLTTSGSYGTGEHTIVFNNTNALHILDANDCERLLTVEVSFVNVTATPNGNWELLVSPNPIQAGQRLRVWQNGNAAPEVMISVWDAQGRPIHEFFMNAQEKYLDTEMLVPGIYWLRWQRADGQSDGVKVVVLQP